MNRNKDQAKPRNAKGQIKESLTPEHSPVRLGRLIRDHRFWPLFWTQFLGAFNDNLFKNSIVLLITFRSSTLLGLSSEKLVALCGGIFILPFFLYSALAGEIADQRSKSTIARWTKIWEIGVMLLGGAAFLLDSLPFLLITLFLMGAQSAFFGPVKYGILPELLHRNELVAGNALIEVGTFISILLGTMASGLIYGEDLQSQHTLIGVLIFISALGYWASKFIPHQIARAPHLKVALNPILPTLKLFQLARKTHTVFLSILAISWFWLLGAVVLSILPNISKNLLGSDQTLLTLFLGIFSIGVGVGSILTEKMSHRVLELGIVPLGSIGMSLFALDLGWMDYPRAANWRDVFSSLSGWRLTLDLFLFSVSAGLFTVPLYTLLQIRSAAGERSRIIAANNVLNAFFMVVGSIGLMVLYAIGLSVQQIFIVLSILNLAVAIYVYGILPEFLLRLASWFTARILYRIRLLGADHFPTEGPALIVANHVTFVDWLLISAVCPRPIRFLMHYSFLNLPLLGWFFRHGKVIPIAGKNENPELMEAAFKTVAEALRAGQLVCMFPEGEITKSGKMAPFRKGLEHIIREAPVPVIPVALDGLWGSFFSRKYGRAFTRPFRRFWSRIRIQVLPPVSPDQASADKLQALISEYVDYR